MMIFDAQIHVWAGHTRERYWPEDGFGRKHGLVPMMFDVLLTQMDETGINRAVLVPPSWEGDYNDLAIKAAADDPGHFTIMGRFYFVDSMNASRLPNWKSQTSILGIWASF
jgi:L-fuconolactonase